MCLVADEELFLASSAFFTSSIAFGDDGDFDEAGHVLVDLDVHLVLAGGLDWLLQLDAVAVDADLGLLFDGLGDVDGSDRAEGFTIGTRGEGHLELEALDLTSGLLGFSVLFSFALGADLLQLIHMAEIALGSFEGFALGDEEVAGETTLHRDDVGFCPETGDLFFEDNLSIGHDDVPPTSEGRRCYMDDSPCQT
jgi:hypothetical protein